VNLEQFRDFARRLVDRSGLNDWPGATSEYWRDFYRELKEIAATPDEADLASRRACNQPEMFVSKFRPFILAEIPRIRSRKPAPATAPAILARGPALPPPDAPEWEIRSPADLKRFCASLAASKSARGRFVPHPARRRDWDDARVVPADSELADVDDPVVIRELSRRERPRPEPAVPVQAFRAPEAGVSFWDAFDTQHH
jgi:hypothetical protein